VPLDTSADSPVPVRTVLQLVGGWISRLGRVWVEGQIAELAVRPALVDVLDTLHHGEAGIGVEELLVGSGMAAIGKTIAEAGLLDPSAAKLLALRRRDGTLFVSPSPELRLEEGDLIIALGTEAQLLTSTSLLK